MQRVGAVALTRDVSCALSGSPPVEVLKVDKSLTIALPIHNGESCLRRCVPELLELASELTQDFSILIIDDGSTDDTYEVAQELALRYPQIWVRRHRVRRGLGPTIESIERRVHSDVVIVHDGTSEIDPQQVRRLWRRSAASAGISMSRSTSFDATSRWDQGELAELPAIHAAMASAHQRLLGFQLLRSERGEDARPMVATTEPTGQARAKYEPSLRAADVGRIPPLPRPKFLSALAEFALGE
jgi:Glycosyl transferase family 2